MKAIPSPGLPGLSFDELFPGKKTMCHNCWADIEFEKGDDKVWGNFSVENGFQFMFKCPICLHRLTIKWRDLPKTDPEEA